MDGRRELALQKATARVGMKAHPLLQVVIFVFARPIPHRLMLLVKIFRPNVKRVNYRSALGLNRRICERIFSKLRISVIFVEEVSAGIANKFVEREVVLSSFDRI